MNEEQKRAAFNAVMSALIALGATNRDAMYAAEAAVQNLTKWEARFVDLRDLVHEADMRALAREQLRGDISPEEAEEELADQRAMLDQEQPD